MAKGKKNPNGWGSIWQRPDGRWSAALSYPYHDPQTGRTKSRRLTTTKRSWEDARRWLVQKQHDLLGGVPDAPENPLVSEYLAAWLADVVEPQVAPKTFEKRAYHVRSHISPALGHARLKGLEPRQIHSFYVRMARREERGLAPLALSTRRAVHTTLKMALDQAVRWGQIARNPCGLVDPPKAGPGEVEREVEDVRALADAEARLLFARGREARSRWRNYYVAGVRTGLRPGEMLGLWWGDLVFGGEVVVGSDLDSLAVRRTLAIREGTKAGAGTGSGRNPGGRYYTKPPKTKASRRTLVLHWEASGAFRAQRDMLREEGLPTGPRDWVFPSKTGRPMSRETLRSRHLQPDLEAAGLPRLTLHELRHTFASIMLYEWRVPLEVVSQMMGHSSPRMTQDLYGHLVKTAQADSIRALRDLQTGARRDA